MKSTTKRFSSSITFLLEVLVYTGLVVTYYLLVLHYLGDWIKQVLKTDKVYYALLAVGLIAGQSVVLERVTAILLWLGQCLQNIIPVLYRMTRPYESIDRPEEAPGLLVYRFAGPLYYFNAAYFASRVEDLIDSADEPVKVFLLNSDAMVDMDMNGLEVLEQAYLNLRAQRIVLALCEVKGDFRKELMTTTLPQRPGFKIYASVKEAIGKLDLESSKKAEEIG